MCFVTPGHFSNINMWINDLPLIVCWLHIEHDMALYRPHKGNNYHLWGRQTDKRQSYTACTVCLYKTLKCTCVFFLVKIIVTYFSSGFCGWIDIQSDIFWALLCKYLKKCFWIEKVAQLSLVKNIPVYFVLCLWNQQSFDKKNYIGLNKKLFINYFHNCVLCAHSFSSICQHCHSMLYIQAIVCQGQPRQ